MSGRHIGTHASAAPVSGAAAVGAHAVDCLESLAALVLTVAPVGSALVLTLPRELAASPALQRALKAWVQAGKSLPILALVVPSPCIGNLRQLAADLAHSGALLAVFSERDDAAAHEYAEGLSRAISGHAQQGAAAAARSDAAFREFLCGLLSLEAGSTGGLLSAGTSQRHGS